MAPAQLRPALLSSLLSSAAALSSSIAAPRAAASWRSADWSSCFRSATECRDRVDLDVLRGAVPPALEGTVYKVGPGRFEAGGEPFAHWLDGDGYAFAVEFRGGAASFVARFVETAGFADEARAGAVVWRTTFGTNRRGGPLANAFDLRLKNPANTAMLPLPDRGVVLALWEAGPPHALDARTLETLGPDDLGGALAVGPPGALPLAAPAAVPLATGDALSAHAKTCAATGRTVCWSWRNAAVGDDLAVRILELDAGGAVAERRAASTLEGAAFAPHDFAVTRDACSWVTCPTKVEPLPYILGLRGPAQTAFFDGAKIAKGEGATVHRVGRRGGGPAERVPCAGAYHAVHVAAAWDRTVLACCWPPAAVASMAERRADVLGDWGQLLAGDFSSVAVTQLVRFDLDRRVGDRVAPEVLCGGAHLDHAKQHPRYVGLEARYVFASAGDAVGRGDAADPAYAAPQPPQAFVRVDVAGGGAVADAWRCGPRRFVDDAVLVDVGDGELDVFVVAPVFDAATKTSTIVVLDGGDLAAGPVCELALPGDMFIPWGLHGAWAPRRKRR